MFLHILDSAKLGRGDLWIEAEQSDIFVRNAPRFARVRANGNDVAGRPIIPG